jgi:biopolymer transport protein ExbB
MNQLSFWSLVMDGGYIMIPLAILLIVAIYVFTERCIVINRAAKEDKTFMDRIRDYVHEGDIKSAENLCKKADTPSARLIAKGLSRIGRPMNDVLVAIENTGNIEVAALGKGFTWLSTTAAGAPMLGFLGTVTGMVQAFYSLSASGTQASISVLSSGIYQALVTTVAGLIVGILALFAYNYLTSRVNRVMNSLETKTMEFMDLLNEPC